MFVLFGFFFFWNCKVQQFSVRTKANERLTNETEKKKET